jgi:hypothetical protein
MRRQFSHINFVQSNLEFLLLMSFILLYNCNFISTSLLRYEIRYPKYANIDNCSIVLLSNEVFANVYR